MEILLITAKTDFGCLIFQMLASYISDVITWQMSRKFIFVSSFFKDPSLIKVTGQYM